MSVENLAELTFLKGDLKIEQCHSKNKIFFLETEMLPLAWRRADALLIIKEALGYCIPGSLGSPIPIWDDSSMGEILCLPDILEVYEWMIDFINESNSRETFSHSYLCLLYVAMFHMKEMSLRNLQQDWLENEKNSVMDQNGPFLLLFPFDKLKNCSKSSCFRDIKISPSKYLHQNCPNRDSNIKLWLLSHLNPIKLLRNNFN